MCLRSGRRRSSIYRNYPRFESTFHRGIFTKLYRKLHLNIADFEDDLFIHSSLRCCYQIVTHGLYGSNKIKAVGIGSHPPPLRWMKLTAMVRLITTARYRYAHIS
ncbi:hypothetical protein SUDANB1_05402 [Streptomyces sp. enrichment culture]